MDLVLKNGKYIMASVASDKTVTPQPVTDKDRIDLLVAENVTLKARLAKIEAVPIVKATLEPVIKDPILTT